MIKIKNHHNVNKIFGLAMLQKLPVNKSEWIADTSLFKKFLWKSYNEESEEGYFLEVDIQYSWKLHKLHNALLSLPERLYLYFLNKNNNKDEKTKDTKRFVIKKP